MEIVAVSNRTLPQYVLFPPLSSLFSLSRGFGTAGRG